MLSFVIFLIFSIFGAGATDAPDGPCHLGHQVIRISGSDWNFPYKVVKGKPLHIHLDIKYVYVECSKFTDRTLNYKVELTYCGSDSIIKVKNVTDAMNSKWECTVYRECVDNKTKTSENCTFLKYFTIHVMGAIPVIVTINKALVMPVQTNNMAYDGEAKYFYENGQFMDFECSQKQDGNYQLLLNYYNAQGIPLLETRNQTAPISFRAYLNSFHHYSYIVCIIYPTKEPQIQYHYKTTFIMKETDFYRNRDYIIVSVNGLQLAPMGSNITRTDDLNYEYGFIESEDLNIICQKSNNRIKGKLLYNNTSELDVTTVQSDSNDTLRLQIQTKLTTKNRTLSCGTNDDDKKLFARILFLDNLPWNEIRIFGLPPKNVLYEYRSVSHQSTIAYQYTVNETLSLTCVTKVSNKIDNPLVKSKLQWKFNDNVLDTESISNNFLLKSTTNITLTEKDNETKIQCIGQLETKNTEYIKVKVEVIFKLKPELLPEDDNVLLGSLVISIITAAVIIVTVTTICLICWFTGGTRNVKHTENEYENLSNPDSSPIPSFPNQWDNQREDSHYTKIDEGVMLYNPSYAGSILYTLPHIRQSTSSENHYTEIDDYFKSKTDRLENNLQIDEDRSNSRDVGNDISNLSKRSYVNVPRCRKKKGVTFEYVNNGQNSNESHNLKQCGSSNYVNEVLQINYANAFPDVQVKAKRGNGSRAEQNEENSNYLEYAVPYSCSNEIVNCDNELYNKK